MNRKFAIIIAVATVFLIALLTALSAFRYSPKSSEQVPGQIMAPTSFPIRRESNRTTTTPPSLSKEKQASLAAVQSKLPVDSDSFAIDYSALTNKIYVELKNDSADADFQKFLEDNDLLDIYDQDPELFITSRSNLKTIIDEDEQRMPFDFDQDVDQNPAPTLSPLSVDEAKVVKQLKTFEILFNLSLAGNIVDATPIPSRPASQQPGQAAPAPILTGANTSNIPCSAGSDYGVADGYRNGALTKIRVCRVKGFVVNSQISKQFNDLHTAAASSGIVFGGGSFRTMTGQIGIYQSWCRRDGIVGSPPPYPKAPGQTIKCPGGGAPGYSNHQMGLAIDFNCDGALLPRKYADAVKNRCFQWLQANASRYGFYEVGMGKESSRTGPGYEGWHWSVNGN